MKTTRTILNVYVTNLGKYNEGELIGKWLTLPATDEEIEKTLDEIGINQFYEEYFITDFETDFGVDVHEYESLDNLNEIAETIEAVDDYDLDKLAFLIDNIGLSSETIENLIDKLDDVQIFTDCNDWEDIARAYMEETGELDQLPDWAQNYFDFDAFGRDLKFDAYTYDFIDGDAYILWNY